METIRDIKTLLRLLLAKGEELSISKKDANSASMCYWIGILFRGGDPNTSLITRNEHRILKEFIHNNRPIKGIYFDKEFSNSNYFWSPFNFDIRLRWIKYQLRRNLS